MFHIPRRGDGEEVPLARHALEVVSAVVFELRSRQDSGHLLRTGACALARNPTTAASPWMLAQEDPVSIASAPTGVHRLWERSEINWEHSNTCLK
jgi:hypothetical protein